MTTYLSFTLDAASLFSKSIRRGGPSSHLATAQTDAIPTVMDRARRDGRKLRPLDRKWSIDWEIGGRSEDTRYASTLHGPSEGRRGERTSAVGAGDVVSDS